MHHPVIYIMGVSGSGKSTIGEKLSDATGIPFFDGDDFHSASNKEKMRSGTALTDDDRKEWLRAIAGTAERESAKRGAIIACSALKEKYRAALTRDVPGPVHWVFLQGDYKTISRRIKARHGHYMPASLLQSQFEALEPPAGALTINVNTEPGEIVKEIMQKIVFSGK